MMNKSEMITLIKAYDAIQKLDNAIAELFNTEGLNNTDFEDALGISDVLFRNCSFYEDETKAFERFYEIVMDDGLTAEEKYEKMRE